MSAAPPPQWRMAEERLYPSLMAMAPERYELYIAVVREIADDLQVYLTSETLIQAYGSRETLLASASTRLGEGSDPQLVVDAAFGLRHREVAEQSRRAEVRRRIAQASTDWVMLRQRGAASLELHVPTGTGLAVWVEEDVDTGSTRSRARRSPARSRIRRSCSTSPRRGSRPVRTCGTRREENAND